MTKDYAPPSTTRGKTKPAGKSKAKAKPKAKASTKKSGAKAAPAPVPESRGRGKLFLSLAILIGGFAYGLYFLQSIPPAAPLEEDTQSVAKKQSQSVPKENEEKETQRFKFYDLLPQSEVVPPKVSTYQFKEKEQGESYYYVVQTGSFKSMADAEKQKATIAFQGLKGSIRSVESQSGTVWHRVSTGPFYTRTEMNAALDKLVAINIEPLVKKIKKDQ